jgi:L-malate glycosyltransferase
LKIAHLDSGTSWRGGQAQVWLLMQGLKRRGQTCALLAPEGPLLVRAREAGFETWSWRPRGDLDGFAMLRATRALRGVDVAHAHSARAHAVGVPAARLARVPAVVVSRRVDFDVAAHALSRLKYCLPVDRYLCISRGVMDVMARGGVPRERLALVPSGVSFEDVGTSAFDLRRSVGAAPDAPLIGTVAALAPHKDHADLMRAAAIVTRRIPAARFVWLGEGECRAELERQRRELGLESVVHLLGFRDDAKALMRQFTVFALSSYLEGLCTSLLDAQWLGVPIVATRVGGVPDVIEDGVNGRLVEGRDPAAFAAALIEAIEDPRQREAWARAGRRSVEDFSADRMVERTLETYETVRTERGIRDGVE